MAQKGPSICVTCAWRLTCNKKFSMDGATTTRCPDFTRDITLKEPSEEDKNDVKTGDHEL